MTSLAFVNAEHINECEEASQDLWGSSRVSPVSRLDSLVPRGFTRCRSSRLRSPENGALGAKVVVQWLIADRGA